MTRLAVGSRGRMTIASAQDTTPRVFREPGIELVPGVHALGPSRRGISQGGYSRAYLFEHDDGLTLVDTLWDDDAHLVLKYLWSLGRTPAEIRHIAITHAHRSHLGGLATLRALSGATVHSHAEEAPIIEGRRAAVPIPLRPLRPVELFPFRLTSHLGIPAHVPCPVDDPGLEEGGTVGPLTVLHMPGHTPGNLAFSWDKHRVLAVADTITTWPSFSAGWPGFNLDEALFRESVARVVALAPEILATGHGDPVCERTAERLATLVS